VHLEGSRADPGDLSHRWHVVNARTVPNRCRRSRRAGPFRIRLRVNRLETIEAMAINDSHPPTSVADHVAMRTSSGTWYPQIQFKWSSMEWRTPADLSSLAPVLA